MLVIKPLSIAIIRRNILRYQYLDMLIVNAYKLILRYLPSSIEITFKPNTYRSFFRTSNKMACNIFLTLQPGSRQMPVLGYGTWQSSGDDIEKGLEVALETGYRHIDTAARYQNEEIIGGVLKKWLDSGRLKREDLFITTKLAPTDMRPNNVEKRLRESLGKLQLDYVDLYLIHFPISMIGDSADAYGDPNITYLDIWKKMEEQVDAGRTKTIGVSNFSVKKVDNILKNCRIKPANNQVEMHVYFQQRELVDFCTKNGVTIVAYAPLGTRGYNVAMKKFGRPTKVLPDLLSDEVVNRIAKKHSKTPAQVLIRYLLQVGVSTIPKSVTPSRIKENFNVFDFALDEQDMKDLLALDKGVEGRISDFKGWARLEEHPHFEF